MVFPRDFKVLSIKIIVCFKKSEERSKYPTMPSFASQMQSSDIFLSVRETVTLKKYKQNKGKKEIIPQK